MAPSFDMAASILLCAEDSSSVFGFGDGEEVEEAKGARAGGSPYCGELAVEFPLPSEECVARWVATEAEHLPREDYAERLRAGGVDLRVRVDAVDWIWKVHTYYGFGPVTACLALNYMDRFLSLYQIPEGKAWMTQLLSVACLSLAAKMDETSVPHSIDLQAGDARYVFEAKTIQRMELLVLSTLKWRMQAVTPFSYLDYFLHQLSGGNAPSRQAVREATELILCISRGTSCLEFRPSEIAATVAAAVAGEEHTAHKPACCTHVDKERVLSCHEAMIRTTGATVPPPKTAGLMGSAYSPAMSAPRSPTGVLDLDAGYLSCPSNGTSTTTTTMASSPPASSGFDGSPVSSKRRKISR
ncbi:cyclin-D4-1 [Aegilops tauschii subsp. strangulata]|nr:cyclin-D4-1 [Aegilops tauschii subsp. strangulata]